MTASLPELSFQPFDQVNTPQFVDDQSAQDIDAVARRLQTALFSGFERLQWYDAYLEGEQPLRYMSPAMAVEVQGLLSAVILNWCRMATEMYSNRLRIDGFRYAGDEENDSKLWEVVQANGLDRFFQHAFYEAVGMSRSYMIVGAPDKPGAPPIVTVESPFQVSHIRDPRTRKVTEAFKLWTDQFGDARATLYQPNRTVPLRSDGSKWIVAGEIDNHGLGMVPVVPFVNRPRILRPNGVSEFHDVIPIVDAAIKAATDMMVSAEYHAMPRRWIFGLKKSDFKDQNGNAVSAWSRLASRIWSAETKDVTVGQFSESDLRNFHDTIKLLARLVGQILAAPDALAFDTVNPPSAEAFGAMNNERDMRVRAKQVEFGESAEDVTRLVLRFQTGEWDPRALSIETVWADPSSMTFAQKADGITKLMSAKDGAGRTVLNAPQARLDLGYGAIARARMAEDDTAAQRAVLDIIRDSADTQPQVDPVPSDDAGV